LGVLLRTVSGVQERLPEVLAVPAVTVLAVLGGLCLSTTPAKAQCAPDPASSGQTVTCSNDANGFDSGGVNNLTVNVLPGAVVNDNGTAGIAVSDFSVVTNNGTIAAASGATGIFAGQNNAITNTATGTITVAGDGFGNLRRRQQHGDERRRHYHRPFGWAACGRHPCDQRLQHDRQRRRRDHHHR
jgi:hypothetical protein